LHTGTNDRAMGTLRAEMRADELGIVDAAINKAMSAPTRSPDSPAGESGDQPAKAPIAHRRLDALVRICESYLVHGDGARSPDARNHAVVHVEVGDDGVLAGATEAGLPLHHTALQRLLCDARIDLQRLRDGVPLDGGRSIRTVNRRLRRALARRSHGSCEWDGCDERRYVQAHHVWHWEDGGPTDLWNLVNLCWFHHHLVHEGGWSITHDGHGHITTYHRPDGSHLAADRVAVGDLPPLDTHVAPDAIVPRWAGERFDLDACVDATLAFTSTS
jgi:hypothetical protein